MSKIVLGIAKEYDNTLGERAEETKEFQAMLQRRTGLEVVLWDERLTTMESERILQEGGVRRENRKERIDWMAGYSDSAKLHGCTSNSGKVSGERT